MTAHNIDLEVTGGLGHYTYLWNDGVTTEDRFNLPDGIYCVTVTDRLGCTAASECYRAMPFGPTPRAEFYTNDTHNPNIFVNALIRPPTICQGDSLTFEDHSTPDNTIISRRWEFMVDSTGPIITVTGNQRRVAIRYNRPGKYKAWLTVKDTLGQESMFAVMGPHPYLITVLPKTTLRIARVVQECVNNENKLRVEMPNGSYTYEWSNGYTGYSADGIRNTAPVASGNVPPGRYCVTIKEGALGCSTKDTCIDFQPVCDPFIILDPPIIRDTTPQRLNCTSVRLRLPHRTTSTTAQINWQAMQGVSHYQVSWRKFGSNQWQNVRLNNPNAADYLITNLQPFTTYQFRVQPWCIGAWQYAGGGIGTFTTQP